MRQPSHRLSFTLKDGRVRENLVMELQRVLEMAAENIEQIRTWVLFTLEDQRDPGGLNTGRGFPELLRDLRGYIIWE